MTAFYGITPLAPAYVLLSGAVLLLLLGLSLTTISRHWLRVVVCGAALLALIVVDTGTSSDGSHAVQLHTLVEWPDGPAIAFQRAVFQPLSWSLVLSLLAIVLAARGFSARFPLGGQVLMLVLAASAFTTLSAGTFRTLAVTTALFDTLAALWWLFHRRSDRAVGRLALAVLTGAGILTLASGLDRDLIAAPGLPADPLFSVAVWLRLGLYPLFEAGTPAGAAPPMRHAWLALNLVVGLHLVTIGLGPEMLWPGLVTALLHAALAWLEPRRERALVHAAWALAGTALAAAALGMRGPAVVAGGVTAVMGWLALALTPYHTAYPAGRQPSQVLRRLLPYVPLAMATITWAGLPFTLGWLSRGALMQLMWDTRGPQALALIVVTSGAALSVLYRAWQAHIPKSVTAPAPSLERSLGATVAATPFLVPVLSIWFVSLATTGGTTPATFDLYGIGAWIGLGGVLLWAIFLGYGRDWLALLDDATRERIVTWLRLDWLLRRAEQLVHAVGRVLLRLRAVGEGEHYLAWALLVAIGTALALLFSPLARGT
jgi:hypothetical protein